MVVGVLTPLRRCKHDYEVMRKSRPAGLSVVRFRIRECNNLLEVMPAPDSFGEKSPVVFKTKPKCPEKETVIYPINITSKKLFRN